MEIHERYCEPWKVTLIDTGLMTQTGAFSAQSPMLGMRPYVDIWGWGFKCGYSETSSSINHMAVQQLYRVQPEGRYGSIVSGNDGKIANFMEKPPGDGAWINAGFFVLEPSVFDYLKDGDSTIFERAPLENLAKDGELYSFKHYGFWKAMDTLRDKTQLQEMWDKGNIPGFWINMFLEDTFHGKSVLVTGHTGFKGSWLCLWLSKLGAKVHGYSLPPDTDPNHYKEARIYELLASERFGNICDRKHFTEYIHEVRPDCIFHLAAQPIVRRSYREPVETFEANVMGSIYLMDALRTSAHPCTAVMITSDKCYLNTNQIWGYRECDPLGGHDPYSASKAAAEIAIASYRDSYFPPEKIGEHKIHIASVRAGNVIGGGDGLRIGLFQMRCAQ